MEQEWSGIGGECRLHLGLQFCHQGAPEALSGESVRLRSEHPAAPGRLSTGRLQVAHACLGPTVAIGFQASEPVCARATAKVLRVRWLPKVLLPASEAPGAF